MRIPVILATLLLAGAPALLAGAALAATPAAVQAEQSPTMPGAEGGFGRHGGGKLAGFFTPEQRAMFMFQARDQVKDMTKEQRKAWRKDQIQHVVAMSDSDRAKFKADLQSKWDALPQGQKDRLQQRMARFGGQNPAQ
jgi:hypothetical protein